ALSKLRAQLPTGRPLTAVRITAEGESVVVRDGATLWEPESGQTVLDFGVAELARAVAPLARRSAEEAIKVERDLGPDDWYALGCDLEPVASDEARDAYRRALELDPGHAGARINLGRLLHDAGEPEAALKQYRHALVTSPDNGTAAFNLGVALEDLGRTEEAIEAYELAVRADPSLA